MADERVGTVARITEHAPDVRSIHLALDAPLFFSPGHFVSCRFEVGDGTVTRAYSIASHPDQTSEIEILLSLVPGGPGSTHLFGLGVGDPLAFTGPWGTFVLEEQPAAETIFVADGVTIAPIRPMLRRAAATGRHPLRLLYGHAPGTPLVYADELVALAATHHRFAWEPLDTGALEDVVAARYVTADADRTRHFFVCAIGDRARRFRRLLRDAGYERRAVHYERW